MRPGTRRRMEQPGPGHTWVSTCLRVLALSPTAAGLGHSLYLSGPQFYTCKSTASDVIYVSRLVKNQVSKLVFVKRAGRCQQVPGTDHAFEGRGGQAGRRPRDTRPGRASFWPDKRPQ